MCWAYRLVVERADESVAIAIFGGGYRSLGLDHGVDPTNCAVSVGLAAGSPSSSRFKLNCTYPDGRPQSRSRKGDGS